MGCLLIADCRLLMYRLPCIHPITVKPSYCLYPLPHPLSPHPTPSLCSQPNMDGPTATKLLREQLGFTNPIVGLTGNGMPKDIEHFIKVGGWTNWLAN